MKRLIGHLLPVSFVLIYGILPQLVFEEHNASTKLSALTSLGCLFYLLGYYSKSRKIFTSKKISFRFVAYFSFSVYFLSFLFLFVTADNIPLISSLRGADPDLLALYREDFVKNRTGIEGVFRYTYTIFGGSLVPIFLVFGIDKNPRLYRVLISLYFLSSIVVLAKANFLRIGIPLFVRYLYQSANKSKVFFRGMIVLIGLLVIMYKLAGDRNEVVQETGDFWSAHFFTPDLPKLITWRVVSIPVVSARDWLVVFESDFNSDYFLGRTSSFLAFFTDKPKIHYEKLIFKHQWGGDGNANAFYAMEAFVNFGIGGVIIISFLIGKFIKLALSQGLIGVITAPLFVYFLFNTGFIGTMLSNGYILILLMFNFIKIEKSSFSYK